MTETSLTSTGPTPEAASKKKRMSTRNRVLFFVTAWFIAFMPVWFWWNTWFGRTLSDRKIGEYLQDNAHPRHIQQALVQVSERMSRHDTSLQQ